MGNPVFVFLLILTMATSTPNQREFQSEQVRILVDVQSNIYTYEVTNLGSKGMVGFEVASHAAYNFVVPQGWEKEQSDGLFRSWTSDEKKAIGTNETAQFSLRVSSKGAVLGRVRAKVRFQDGQTITLAGVWAPIPEPRSYLVLVAVLLVVIILLQTVIVYRRRKGGEKAIPNDA